MRAPHPCLEELVRWGYPRKLAEVEFDPARTAWFRLGSDIVFWINRGSDLLCVHVCTAPGTRFVTDARRWLSVLDFLADLEGVDGLWAKDCGEGGEVADYLDRLGWERQEDGGYIRWAVPTPRRSETD